MKIFLIAFLVCISLSCAPEEGISTENVDKSSDLLTSEQVLNLLDDLFEERLALSPERLTYLGRKERYDEWDDISEAAKDLQIALSKKQLEQLNRLKIDGLDEKVRLNVRLLKNELKTDIENDRWRYHNYPVNQMFGVHSAIPSLLISAHKIDSDSDAQAYITRLETVETKIQSLLTGLKRRQELGVIAPDFVFAQVIDDSRNLISGVPFDDSGFDSTLLTDFKKKVSELPNKDQLIAAAESALLEHFKPAYERLIAFLEILDDSTSDNNGVWALPNGSKYYQARLKAMTTTAMTAEEIHQMGLEAIASIHKEMEVLMKVVKFEGTLADFFVFMREDPQFYFSNDETGRAQYLAMTDGVINAIKTMLPQLFTTLPEAGVEVRRVEAYREKSAGKAFYQRPSEDGTRDGIYYVNLYDTNDMPIYQLEALAYHEALPGHHMQIAINQEIEGLPKFRRYNRRYTAYTEGWGLYSEYVPKEMGFYGDPYSDFGRLSMALWRAARLVVDTGLHAKKWSKEQAIAYLVENTPNPERDCRRAIERYMVMPGQATAYYVGMTKILELRKYAETALKDKFDIREFHDLILSSGSLPLDTLSAQVENWVDDRVVSDEV